MGVLNHHPAHRPRADVKSDSSNSDHSDSDASGCSGGSSSSSSSNSRDRNTCLRRPQHIHVDRKRRVGEVKGCCDGCAMLRQRMRPAWPCLSALGFFVSYASFLLLLGLGDIAFPHLDLTGKSRLSGLPNGKTAYSVLTDRYWSGLRIGVLGAAAPRDSAAHETACTRMALPNYNSSDPAMWQDRKQRVVDAFRHAWSGYSAYAFGTDELRPLTKTGSTVDFDLGLTILDALDTAFLLQQYDIYDEGRRWVAEHFSNKLVNRAPGRLVNVFETTIRALGGLLGAHALTGDRLYVDKSRELADRMMLAFDSPSGIPYASVDLSSGRSAEATHNQGASSTAEVGTLQLEFRYLSHVTGDDKYREVVDKIILRIAQLPSVDGLVPIFISPKSGSFTSKHIRLGSRGDSYYEYLLKQYVQTNGTESLFRDMYDRAMDGVKAHLLGHSHPNGLTYVGELREGPGSTLWPKMDHLVCFLPATLALGATGGFALVDVMRDMSRADFADLQLARELADTCYQTYTQTATGLAPEITFFNTRQNQAEFFQLAQKQQALLFEDFCIHQNDRHYLLRPETVESLFVLFRITGDLILRERAWDIFMAIEKHAWVESGGFASLKDVTDIRGDKDNKMETFFLSETLKYLYLMFSDEEILPLNRWVFNTEAHPFPILHEGLHRASPSPPLVADGQPHGFRPRKGSPDSAGVSGTDALTASPERDEL